MAWFLLLCTCDALLAKTPGLFVVFGAEIAYSAPVGPIRMESI